MSTRAENTLFARIPPAAAGVCAVLPEVKVREILGLSKITLHRMRQLEDCGGLPYIRLSPGRLGYLLSDVNAFITARRVGTLQLRNGFHEI